MPITRQDMNTEPLDHECILQLRCNRFQVKAFSKITSFIVFRGIAILSKLKLSKVLFRLIPRYLSKSYDVLTIL